MSIPQVRVNMRKTEHNTNFETYYLLTSMINYSITLQTDQGFIFFNVFRLLGNAFVELSLGNFPSINLLKKASLCELFF